MRKVLSLFLSIVILLSITAGIDFSALASTSGYYQFTISSGKATITRYTGAESEVIIPSTLSGYVVTTIGQAAFSDADSTRTVVIPDTVTKIGVKAFCSSDVLSTVTIGKNVTTIESEAFYNCNLSYVFLPVSLTTVGNNAFKGNGSWCYYEGYLAGRGNKCHVYYGGNETQWNKISFGSGNEPVSSSSVEFNANRIGEHVFGNADIVPPSCENEGYTHRICKVCNYEEKNNYVSAAGHNWNGGVITTYPSCTATGVRTYTCTACGTTKTEAVAKKSHTYKTYTTKAAINKNGSVVTKCTICGAVKSRTVINSVKSVWLSKTSYTYNGKVQTPSVTVKDSKGKTLKKNTDYTVTYARGRKNVGKYVVKITFKGKYSGSKTLYYTIKPKSTSISKVTAGKKKFTVKWKKYTTQTTGYQIQYSTNKNFKSAKTVTVSKNKTTSKSISKLKAKKKYYVRIRTYKTVGNTKYYSSWSKTKTITTKK